MKIYAVGGAVRDALMGLQPHDFDWVVVGATPQAMQELGYRPVGKDFPIFLHPETQEEHALARSPKDQVTLHGERAFFCSPDVSLEDDLLRRDLTINAMAQAVNERREFVGPVIDPYGGQQDLRARILRHVGDAFHDDPLRIVRVARFRARWPEFSVAPETQALARQISASGVLRTLSPERIQLEVFKGLNSAQPSRLLETLEDLGAIGELLPELCAGWGVSRAPEKSQHALSEPGAWGSVFVGRALDWASSHGLPSDSRFALLACGLLASAGVALEAPILSVLGSASPVPPATGRGSGSSSSARSGPVQPTPLEQWSARWKLADSSVQTARLLLNESLAFSCMNACDGVALAALFERADVRRAPKRFELAWAAFEALCASASPQDAVPLTLPSLEQAQQARERWQCALRGFLSVDAGAVARQATNPLQAREAVRVARENAVLQALSTHANGTAPLAQSAERVDVPFSRKRPPGLG